MEHLHQVQRAIDFIEQHLEDDLDVGDIAKEAAFSRWHFQTVFGAMVGDSCKEYIRKRRLSEALNLLTQTDLRIIDVSLRSGFESQEAFTRAFKNFFGVTPGECRKLDAGEFKTLQKPKITMAYLDHLYRGVNMQPVFRSLPEFSVIGVGERFISILSPEKNNHIVIPKLWETFFQKENQIKSRAGLSNYGVCSPLTSDQFKEHPDEGFYMAATAVTDTQFVPEGMTAQVIPQGEYAVFTHKGALKKLEHTINYIYGSWLPKSGRKLRLAPDLEIYDHRFSPNDEASEFEILIPIE